MDEELQRYIEYLQRSLLSPGSELAHDTAAFRQWVTNNRARLDSIAQLSGGTAETVDALERPLAHYAPRSIFDSFTASAIFGPILETVLDAAREANLAPQRQILFANSTDLSASAAARPSSGEHLLFAGVGPQRGGHPQRVSYSFISGLARLERFELPTPWFVAKYSIQLSYRRADKPFRPSLVTFWSLRIPCGTVPSSKPFNLLHNSPDSNQRLTSS